LPGAGSGHVKKGKKTAPPPTIKLANNDGADNGNLDCGFHSGYTMTGFAGKIKRLARRVWFTLLQASAVSWM